MGMTEVEMETLEAIISERTQVKAAEKLKVKQNTISQRIDRMRMKEQKYKSWLQSYERYRMRMPAKYVD